MYILYLLHKYRETADLRCSRSIFLIESSWIGSRFVKKPAELPFFNIKSLVFKLICQPQSTRTDKRCEYVTRNKQLLVHRLMHEGLHHPRTRFERSVLVKREIIPSSCQFAGNKRRAKKNAFEESWSTMNSTLQQTFFVHLNWRCHHSFTCLRSS